MEIHKSAEDYLETILKLRQTNERQILRSSGCTARLISLSASLFGKEYSSLLMNPLFPPTLLENVRISSIP